MYPSNLSTTLLSKVFAVPHAGGKDVEIIVRGKKAYNATLNYAKSFMQNTTEPTTTTILTEQKDLPANELVESTLKTQTDRERYVAALALHVTLRNPRGPLTSPRQRRRAHAKDKARMEALYDQDQARNGKTVFQASRVIGPTGPSRFREARLGVGMTSIYEDADESEAKYAAVTQRKSYGMDGNGSIRRLTEAQSKLVYPAKTK